MNEITKNFHNENMGWNDTIENDGQEYILLSEGDYNFVVTNLERGWYQGSEKTPPCNKAVLTLQVEVPGGAANVRTSLLLLKTLEWKLSSFFRCIGQKKQGERLVMDWNRVVGSQGRAHFKPRTYTMNGEERQANGVDRFYDWDDKYFITDSKWVEIGEKDDLPF